MNPTTSEEIAERDALIELQHAEIDRLRIVINAAFDEIDDSPDEARMILKHSGVINDG